MSNPSMTFASGLYDRMTALATREVKPHGIDLIFVPVNHPRELFDRQAKTPPAWDSSELSASEYITKCAAGDRTWVAIPAFPSRMFRHSFVVYGSAALLATELGIDLGTIEWVEGSLDSAERYGSPTVLPPSLGKVPHVRRLWPDFKEEQKRYFARTGIFPVMYVVVIDREINEKYPFVAKSFFKALDESKHLGLEHMKFLAALRYMLPWLPSELDEIREVVGEDPWPYGIEPNRKTLETFVKFLADQSMIGKPIPLEELFIAV